MIFKKTLLACLLCCFCSVSTMLLGMKMIKPKSEESSPIKLVLSERLYKQRAYYWLLQEIVQGISREKACVLFSKEMALFEQMRLLKCYVKNDATAYVDSEITDGIEGVTKEEFLRRLRTLPSSILGAYPVAIVPRCGKVILDILKSLK